MKKKTVDGGEKPVARFICRSCGIGIESGRYCGWCSEDGSDEPAPTRKQYRYMDAVDGLSRSCGDRLCELPQFVIIDNDDLRKSDDVQERDQFFEDLFSADKDG